MEEKKQNKTKTVEMKAKSTQDNRNEVKNYISVEDEIKNMPIDKLRETCGQLFYQNQQLMNRMKNMDMTNFFKRTDYLFKIVEHPDLFPKEFVSKVVNELCEGLYPQENTKE